MSETKRMQLSIAEAKNAVQAYCEKNGLDFQKIDYFSLEWSRRTGDVVVAFKRSEMIGLGLVNDIQTLPDPVLYYSEDGIVYETEHTKRLRVNE